MNRYRLRVTPPQGEPWERSFQSEQLVIGRASDADLPIADRFLSRHHARLRQDGEALWIEDLGSRNGTRLNDVLIEGPARMTPGDTIQVSGTRILLVDDHRESGLVESQSSAMRVVQDATRLLEETSHVLVTDLASEHELRHYADRLRMLNEVHQALGRSVELDDLLDLILERAFEHLRPEEGAIYLVHEGGEPVRAASRSVAGSSSPPVYSRSLVREVIDKGVAALILDVEHDERFAAAVSLLNAGVRSLAAAPLLAGKEALGMIVLSSRAAKRHFQEADLELLVSLASVAALRLRNVRLAAEAAERRLLEQEIALARRIQTALLTHELPEVAGWELYAGNIPSRTVSGDLYQVMPAPDGRIVLLVADVSGKGIGASLLTASLEALAAAPLEDGLAPDEVCRRVAAGLHRRTAPEKYATAFLGMLDPGTGSLIYANAGHNPALLVRESGEIEVLAATGTPLGLLPTAPYANREQELRPGDTLLIYTDGVTEAADRAEVEYGLPRLRELCGKLRHRPLADFVAAVEDDVAEFADAPPFKDDVTLVAARRL